MPESLAILETGTKPEKYINLLPQIKSLISGETNLYANLANVSAALNEAFKFWWVGFYLVDIEHEDQLVLGPFQVLYFLRKYVNRMIAKFVFIYRDQSLVRG
jgi:L-methionine (R)-S-oxide reductase